MWNGQRKTPRLISRHGLSIATMIRLRMSRSPTSLCIGFGKMNAVAFAQASPPPIHIHPWAMKAGRMNFMEQISLLNWYHMCYYQS